MAAPRPAFRHVARPAASPRPWPLKPVCLAVLGMAAWIGMPPAWALPDGGVPTHGQAQLQATGNGTLTIRQTSAQAGFDWRSFSIAAGERVQVLQPDARSILFNRVTGTDPSLILGQLQANGRVFLSNPRGIVFGAGAQVDVGGLLATTLTVNRSAGADGRWQLSGGDAGTGVLRMDGSIRAPDGTVALVGPQLSVGGNVLAGRLGLAAAGAVQVDVDGDGLIFFNLRDENLGARLQTLPDAHLLARSAELRAAARSQFADTVLNLEGVVRARGLAQQGAQVVIGGAAPQILVDGGASGVTRVAGTLDASATGPGETGGQVRVLGDRVWVDSSARLDARGDAGGGLLHVGGAWQGQGPGRNALHTRVAAGAQLDASAIRLGDGGQVVVWADDSTVFNGAIRARGGLLGGDGGAVETSGLLRLGIGSGTVDAGAHPGFRAGLWLLDPQDISVVAAATGATTSSDGTEAWNEAPGTTLTITATALQTPNASVLLQATRNISINTSVTLSASESFTAQAGGNVDVASGATITTVNQPITLEANRIFNSQTPGGPVYGGTPSAASGTGRVSMLGTLAAGTGAIGISQTGSTGQHVLGGTFSGASLVVTGSAQLAPAVTFNVNTLALPGTVTLAADTSIAVAEGKTLTIAGAIGDGALPAPAFSLTKAGAGTLNLSGTNTYRGGTVVQAGALGLAGGAALADGGALQVDAGATVQLAANETLGQLSGAGSVNLETHTLTVAPGVAASGVFSGGLDGTGRLVKQGLGSLTLLGNNGFSGGTVVAGGTLQVGSDANLGAAESAVTLQTGGTLAWTVAGAPQTTGRAVALGTGGGVLDVTGALALTGVLSGGGTLTKAGVGSLSLTGANSGFTGAVVLDAGTLVLGSAQALGSSNPVSLHATAPTTLAVNADTTLQAIDGGAPGSVVSIAADRTLTTGAADSNYRGSISGGTGSRLVKAGLGDFTLSGATGFTGAIDVTGGALLIASDAALGTVASTLTLNGGALGTSGTTQVTLDAGRSITLAGIGGTLQSTSTAGLDVAGAVVGSGALRKAGEGVLTLRGTNLYEGGTTVAGGVLAVLADVNLGAADKPVTLDGGMLRNAGTSATTLGAGRAVGIGAGGGTIDVTTDAPLTLAGAFNGAGTLVKAGLGTLSLTGLNSSFSGETRIDAGTLALRSATALTNSVVTLGTAAAGSPVLLVADSSTVAALAGGTATVGDVRLADGQTLTTGTVTSTYSGRLSLEGLGGTLAKAGAGNLTLGSATGFTGATRIEGGTLTLGHAAALAGSALTLSGLAADAPVLSVAESSSIVALAGGTAGQVLLADGKTLTTGSATSTYSGRISGVNGALAKLGAGNFTLDGATGFTGATQVDGGTLTLGHADALAGSVVTLRLLDVAAPVLSVAVDSRIAALAGTAAAADVRLADGKALTTGTVTSSYSGKISLAGSTGKLAKAGDGVFTLDGATGFTGAIDITRGALLIASDAALGTTDSTLTLDGGALGTRGTGPVALGPGRAVTIGAGGGTLDVGENAPLTVAGALTGTDALTKAGGGTLSLSGANSGFTGAVVLDAGTLTLGSAQALGSGNRVSLHAATPTTLDVNADTTLQAIDGGMASSVVRIGPNRTLTTGAVDSTYSGSISGVSNNSRLVKAGDGNFTLDGATGFTRSIEVTGGALVIASDAALGTTASTLMLNGGALGTTGTTLVTLDAGRSIALGSNGGTLQTTSTAGLDVAGALVGSGPLRKTGDGRLTLSGSAAYSGGTVVERGVLQVAADAQLGDGGGVRLQTGGTLAWAAGAGAQTSNRALTLGNGGGTLDVAAGVTLTHTGAVTGSGALVKTGPGLLALGGDNARQAANVTVSAGTLRLDHANALAGRTVTLGTLAADLPVLLVAESSNIAALAGGTSVAGTVEIGAGKTLTTGTVDSIYGGGISSGAGSRLAKAGPGNFTLSGATGFTGATRIDGGTLTLGHASALAGSALTLSGLAVDAPVLSVVESSRIVALAGGAAAEVRLAGGKTLTTGADTSTYSGKISGAGATLAKAGAGNFTLDGATGFTGAIRVDGGTLTLGAADALASSVVTLGTVAADAPVLAVATSTTVAAVAGGAAGFGGAGDVQFANGTTLTTGAQSSTFAGRITGAGQLHKADAGTFTLAGSNDYSGSTLVTSGTLRLAQGAALPADRPVHVAGGVLDLNFRSPVVSQLAVSGGEVRGGALTAVSYALQAGTVSADLSGGAGGLSKSGDGLVTLSGDNSYTGTTSVGGGTLVLSGPQALPEAGTLQVTGTGRLDLGGAARRVGLFTLDTSGSVDNGSLLADLYQLNAGTMNASLSGNANLLKRTTGTVVLNSANPGYTGSVTLSRGTLALAQAGALHAGNRVTLDTTTTATLDVRASNSVQALSGVAAGRAVLGSGSTLTNVSTVDSTFSGSITGGGSLAQQGGGVLTLAGSNSYSGGTRVDSGTLQGNAQSLQGNFTVTSRLVFDQVVDGAFSGGVDGNGSLVKQGNGTLQLSGLHQHLGGTQVLAGGMRLAGGRAAPDGGAVSLAEGTTLQVDADAIETLGRLTGRGLLRLQPGAVLTLGDDSDFGFDGGLLGGGALVKQGGGSLTLGGTDGHSGSTTVQGGSLVLAPQAADLLARSTVQLAGQPGVQLQLQGEARIGALASTDGPAAPVVVLDRFTLAVGANDASTSFHGSTQGSGSLVKQGSGTLTLAGSNGHTGATVVQAGSLALRGAQALATDSPVQADAGASLVLEAVQTIGTLAGGGTVQLGGFRLATVVPGDSLFSGQINGSGSLAKLGAGRLTLAGANAFSGPVDLQQGTLALVGGAALADGAAVQLSAGSLLQAADSETLGALSGQGDVLLEAGTLTTTVDGSHTLAGTLSGPGRLAKAGAGSLTLAGSNTHTGGLALLGGSLVVAADSALGALPDAAHPASLLFAGGTLRASNSFSLDARRSLVLQGAGGSFDVDGGHTLTLPGALADGSSAGALAKTGAGTLALTALADSSRSGATLVQAGQLSLQRDGQLGATASALVLDGGTLQVDQTLRLADARPLQLGAAGGTLQVAAGATLRLGGLVADSAGASGGALTKAGAGSLVFDGAADNRFTGATRLLGGNLVLQRDGQLGDAPALATPGQLLIDGGMLQIDGDTVLAASRGLALGAGGATLQVGGGRVVGLAAAVTDAAGASGGSLVKTGDGLLRLQGAGASSYTGATRVVGGTLALAADAQLGAAPATPTPGHLLLDGGTLQAEAGFTLAAARGLQLGLAGGTLHVADGQQLAYAGVLASSSASPTDGRLTKAGGGRLVLDGAAANTHAGATHVRAGTLAIRRDDQLGTAPAAATPGHLLLDGGTLRIDADTTLAAGRGIALGASGGVLDVAAGAGVLYDGVLADAAAGTPGGFDKAGAGSLLLGGEATHTGITRVLGGSLATGGAQRLPQAGAVQLANGASLVLGGDQNLAALGDAPNPGGAPADTSALVDLGTFTLRLDTGADAGGSFYSGAITGRGGQLLKQGGGTLQLAGSGVGRNLVTVDAGLLVSLGGNSLSTEAVVTVAPGAALRLMAPVTVQSLDLAGRLSGPGGLTASTQVDLRDAVVDTTLATATLRSHGGSQLNAAVQADSSLLTGGVLTLGDSGSLQTATLALQGGAAFVTQAGGQLRGLPAVDVADGRLQLAGAEQVASLHLAGTLSGPGSLRVAGATSMQGASVLTSLDTDTLRSTGGNAIDAAVVVRRSATLADGRLALGAGGSLATPLLTLEAGTLATGTGTGLSTDGRLVVQRPATLLLGADQRLASLDLAGTLGAAPAGAAAGGGAAVSGAETGEQRALADPSPATTAAAPQLLVDGAVVLDGATVFTPLSATTLTSSGSTLLAAPVLASAGTTVTGGLLSLAASGQLTTPSLQVQAGGVATGAAQGIQAGAQLALAAGTTLQLGGDQVLARLVDLGATGAGAAPAQVLLGNFSLAAGADGADGVFSGRFSGDGSIAKQGTGTWLLRSDQAHGDTLIEAGTLQLGDGGTSGSLGHGVVVNQGLLRFDRADAVQLTQAISGSGGLQQAGSGSLVITGTGLSYTGDTIVSAGGLRTDGADRLPDASHLRLATGASLATGGDDRLGAITADGAVSLGGSLASTGNQLYNGPVSISATVPVTLSAPLARIEALHVGNQWGAQPLSVDAGQLLLGAGRAGAAPDAAWNNLTLGQLTLRGLADGGVAGAVATSQVDAGQLQIGAAVAAGAAATGDARLDGQLNVLAGNLALRAHAAPVYLEQVPAPGEVPAVDPLRGRPLALASDALWQNLHSQVRTEAGAGLQLQATAGASIRLDQTTNRFEGAVSALSGARFDTAWNAVDLGGLAGQSVIRLSGQVLQVGGGGVEADVLRFTVGQLATDATSPLAARLWYNDATFGQQRSTPGLQITLLPEALATPASLGSADRPLQVRVGGLATGARTEGLNAGYVQLLPKRAAGGGAAVFLAGPKVGEAAYSFFQDGAGDLSEVPLFYNNVLPATPQLAGSLSAVASVSETARRERFDETVRTENVAIRLRAGVIAEVGPGRPATQGSQGLKLPSSCSSAGNLLGCAGVP